MTQAQCRGFLSRLKGERDRDGSKHPTVKLN